LIYPSCSELIACIEISSKEEALQVLKSLSSITGNKLVVYYIRWVTYSYPNASLVYEYEEVSYDDLEIRNDQIGISISKIKNKEIRDYWISLARHCGVSTLASVSLLDEDTYSLLSITYDDDCLRIKAEQHCVERNFTPLSKILEAYYNKSSWRTYDGGSPDDFMSWAKKRNKQAVLDTYRK
jgi:hypothetical protein